MWDKVAGLGQDVHQTFSILAARDASGKVVRRERLEHEDRAKLRARLKLYPPGTPVILEASFGWDWMSDEVEAAGLVPRLANSHKVAQWRQTRGPAKSNRRDAELLSELTFEKGTWWEVWRAPAAVRRLRELMRHRMALVGHQTTLKNRIHAALHRHGILHGFSDLFGVKGLGWLEREVEDAEVPLVDSARLVISENLKMLSAARRRLAGMLRLYRGELRSSEAMRHLRSLPGVGLLLAFTIMAEIGDIGRFKTARHLASYSLLAPIASDSGDDDGTNALGRHVGHVGRGTLKWAWIEAAHAAARRKGEFAELFSRVTEGGKRNRSRGYIAVAHELCRRAYVLLRKQVNYTPLRPARPGSRALVRECTQTRAPYGPSAPAEQTSA
jgi:transposase